MTKFAGKYTRYPDLTGKRLAEGGRRVRDDSRASRPDAPLVTVITVCFNSAKTIAQTFRSIRNQTYDNIDYVVVDGGSTDGTVDIIKAHEDLIDYYVSEPDDGLYYAMNKGIELARGEYVLILNSDDWYARTAVEDLVRARTYSGCDIACARARHVDDKGAPADVMRSMPYDASAYLRMALRHETMLVPASVYDEVGRYDTNFRISADYDFTIRLFEAGYTVYEYPRALLFFRKSGVSHVDVDGVAHERSMVLKKHFSELSDADLRVLINRENHTGAQLLEISRQPKQDPRLRSAIRCYVRDNARNGALGRGRAQWRASAKADLAALHDDRLQHSPKVSVIMAVYGAEETLAVAIESVLAQSLADFELICVNDRSPDSSQMILEEYATRDPRIRLIMNETNIGHGATRNRGVAASKGAYIFHIDPDDSIPEDALRVLYETAATHGSDLVRGAYLREQSHHAAAGFKSQVMLPLADARPVYNAPLADVLDIIRTPEGHWAFLYDADLARRVPYPRDLKMGQDAIFLSCVLSAAQTVSVIPDVVYHYLENANSAMNVFKFQKYFDVLEWRRRAFHVLRNAGIESSVAAF